MAREEQGMGRDGMATSISTSSNTGSLQFDVVAPNSKQEIQLI